MGVPNAFALFSCGIATANEVTVGPSRVIELNKAGYTATSVARGWAGAVFRSLDHLGRSIEAKDRKSPKKSVLQSADWRTDGWTDRQSGVESRSMRLNSAKLTILPLPTHPRLVLAVHPALFSFSFKVSCSNLKNLSS